MIHCPICNQPFKHAGGLRQHARFKHPGQLQMKEMIKPDSTKNGTHGYPWRNQIVYVRREVSK